MHSFKLYIPVDPERDESPGNKTSCGDGDETTPFYHLGRKTDTLLLNSLDIQLMDGKST